MYKDSGNGNPAISGGQGLDAIISVFFRYSELSAVKYDVEQDIIKLEIALNDNINPNKRSQFINKSRKSMELFYKIYKLNPIHFELDFVEHSGITILRLFRDCKTIIESEMELFMKMLRQEFDSLLIKDDNDMVDGVALSYDVKNTLLEKIRQYQNTYHNIFAYRDEGRVFVFNK